jgi:hypothetical protein
VQNETVFSFAASYPLMLHLKLLWFLGQVKERILKEGLGPTMTRVDPLMQALHGCESRLFGVRFFIWPYFQ